MFKKIIKPILIIILAIILLFVAYCAYVLISYHRIDDNTKLEINGSAAVDSLKTNELYRISSANLGFGAYSDDYSFFMDGGTESWAFSKESFTPLSKIYSNVNLLFVTSTYFFNILNNVSKL